MVPRPSQRGQEMGMTIDRCAFVHNPSHPTKMILSTRKSKRSPKRLREDALSNLQSEAFHTAVFRLYLCKELTGLMRNWIS